MTVIETNLNWRTWKKSFVEGTSDLAGHGPEVTPGRQRHSWQSLSTQRPNMETKYVKVWWCDGSGEETFSFLFFFLLNFHSGVTNLKHVFFFSAQRKKFTHRFTLTSDPIGHTRLLQLGGRTL